MAENHDLNYSVFTIEEGDTLTVPAGYGYRIYALNEEYLRSSGRWYGRDNAGSAIYTRDATPDDFLYYEDFEQTPNGRSWGWPYYTLYNHNLTTRYSKDTNAFPSGNVSAHYWFGEARTPPPGLIIATRADAKIEPDEDFVVEIWHQSEATRTGNLLAGIRQIIIKDKTDLSDYSFESNISKAYINEGEIFDLSFRANGYDINLDNIDILGLENSNFEILSSQVNGDENYIEKKFEIRVKNDQTSEGNKQYEFSISDENKEIQAPIKINVNDTSLSINNTDQIGDSIRLVNNTPLLFKKANSDLTEFNFEFGEHDVDLTDFNENHYPYGYRFVGDYTFLEGSKISLNIDEKDGFKNENISYQWFYHSSVDENPEVFKEFEIIEGATNKDFVVPDNIKGKNLGLEINYHDDEGFFTHKRLNVPTSTTGVTYNPYRQEPRNYWYGIKEINNGFGEPSSNWSVRKEKIYETDLFLDNGNPLIKHFRYSLNDFDIVNDPDGDNEEKSMKFNWYLNDTKLDTTETAEYTLTPYVETEKKEIRYERYNYRYNYLEGRTKKAPDKRIALNGELFLEVEYKDRQGFDNTSEKIKIADIKGIDYEWRQNQYGISAEGEWYQTGSGHTNNTPNLNFKIEASDNLFNENTNIKFDFDINELNKDPEGFQENTITYTFLPEWQYGYINGSYAQHYINAKNGVYDWYNLDQDYQLNLNNKIYSNLKNNTNSINSHTEQSYRNQ
ncbi:MAG: hypothetical protein VXX61_02930, partial [Asgard group archaeon]|nr:hypothetical protein [Asgard group archaeon]